MNKNSTHKGKRVVANQGLTTPKVVVTALAILFSSLSIVSAKSVNLFDPHAGLQMAASIIPDRDGEKLMRHRSISI